MVNLSPVNNPIYTELIKTIYYEPNRKKIQAHLKKADSTISEELTWLRTQNLIRLYKNNGRIYLNYPGIFSFIFKTNLKSDLNEAKAELREKNLPKLKYKNQRFYAFMKQRLNHLFSSNISLYGLKELFEIIIIKQGSIIKNNVHTRKKNNDLPTQFDKEYLSYSPEIQLSMTIIKQEVLKISGYDPNKYDKKIIEDTFVLFNYHCFVKHARLNKLYK